jgi:hypothetical protein
MLKMRCAPSATHFSSLGGKSGGPSKIEAQGFFVGGHRTYFVQLIYVH